MNAKSFCEHAEDCLKISTFIFVRYRNLTRRCKMKLQQCNPLNASFCVGVPNELVGDSVSCTETGMNCKYIGSV